MARGLRSGTMESLREVLSVACEVIGVEILNIMVRGESVVIDGEGVSAILSDKSGRAKWDVMERYQVAEDGGDWTERSEVKGTYEIGDESQVARAMALLVAQHRIDAAIDRSM